MFGKKFCLDTCEEAYNVQIAFLQTLDESEAFRQIQRKTYCNKKPIFFRIVQLSPQDSYDVHVSNSCELLSSSGYIRQSIAAQGRLVPQIVLEPNINAPTQLTELLLCYTFSLLRVLRANLSMYEISVGIPPCGRKSLGFVSIVVDKKSCGSQLSPSKHSYCGFLSLFNFFPKMPDMRLVAKVFPDLDFRLHTLFQVLDEKVIWTHNQKRVSNLHFSSTEYLHSTKSYFIVNYIRVKKFKTISLNLNNFVFMSVTVIDGPSSESPAVFSDQNNSIFTSSFQCLTFTTVHLNNVPKKTKIVYSEKELPISHNLSLANSNDIRFRWSPACCSKPHFQYKHFTIQSSWGKDHKVTLNVKQFESHGQSDKDCPFYGVVIFEMDTTETMLFCKPLGIYLPIIYSTTSSVRLFVYQYDLYGRIHTEMHLSSIHCNVIILDPCNVSLHHLRETRKKTNLSLVVSRRTILHFSIPNEQCGTFQIASSGKACKMTIIPKNIVHSGSYRKHSSPFYLISGSSKVLSDMFKKDHKTLWFDGSFKSVHNFTHNIRSKRRFTDLVYRPIKRRYQTFPKHFDVQFEFLISTKQDAFTPQNDFHFTIRLERWSQVQMNIMVWNSPSCSSMKKSHGILVCVKWRKLPQNDQFYIPSERITEPLGYFVNKVPQLKYWIMGIQCVERNKSDMIKVCIKSSVISRFSKYTMMLTDVQNNAVSDVYVNWTNALTCSSVPDMVSLPGIIYSIYIQIDKSVLVNVRWFWGLSRQDMPTMRTPEFLHKIVNFTGFFSNRVGYFLLSYQVVYRAGVQGKPVSLSVKFFIKSWNQASKVCKEEGATLPVIRSREEQLDIVDLMKFHFRPSEVLYIGLMNQVIFIIEGVNSLIAKSID